MTDTLQSQPNKKRGSNYLIKYLVVFILFCIVVYSFWWIWKADSLIIGKWVIDYDNTKINNKVAENIYYGAYYIPESLDLFKDGAAVIKLRSYTDSIDSIGTYKLVGEKNIVITSTIPSTLSPFMGTVIFVPKKNNNEIIDKSRNLYTTDGLAMVINNDDGTFVYKKEIDNNLNEKIRNILLKFSDGYLYLFQKDNMSKNYVIYTGPTMDFNQFIKKYSINNLNKKSPLFDDSFIKNFIGTPPKF